jgi:hypothetical protein
MMGFFSRRANVAASAAAAAIALGALGACNSDEGPKLAPAPVNPIFASYVSLGNSITAGYQSSGINDSTQKHSYAVLLAKQMGTTFNIPLLRFPGCPAPVADVQTGARIAGVPGTVCALRDTTSISPIINNVGVPNAYSVDPFSVTSVNDNPLTQLFLGGKTQVAKALEAHPTFVSYWLGNNDVLAAGGSGTLVATQGVSPGVTPVATLRTNIATGVNALVAGAPGLKGVLIGVVDVTNIPLLFPAAAFFNPAFKAGFEQYAGGPVTILPTCTPLTQSLVSFAIIPQMRAGTHPRIISCEKGAIPGTPVGDIFILDAAEITSIKSSVSQYNAYIAAKADSVGFAYFDPNPTLLTLKAAGSIPTVPNLASATQTFGSYFSLDGVHPSDKAHILIANGLIDAINGKYATTLARLTAPAP